jgi:hypothetical protein
MRLVPRQLQRAGMTGNVAYYSGRFTPAQAYAASHQSWRPPSGTTPWTPQPTGAAGGRTAPLPDPPAPAEDPLDALQRLLDSGVVTQTEFDELRARLTP